MLGILVMAATAAEVQGPEDSDDDFQYEEVEVLRYETWQADWYMSHSSMHPTASMEFHSYYQLVC